MPALPATISILICLLLPSCSLFGLHTSRELEKGKEEAFRKGASEGRAAEVRAAYHLRQQEKALPEPPLAKRYYQVPVSGYTTPDGVKIESHNVTLEVVQP